MKWGDLRQSSKYRQARVAAGGGGIAVLLLVVAGWLCGFDPAPLLDSLGQGTQSQGLDGR